MNENTPQERGFVEAVKHMRFWQRKFFQGSRDSHTIREAKKAEASVDAWLRHFEQSTLPLGEEEG